MSTNGGPANSDDSEGYRIELGARWGPPTGSVIAGAAYESFELSDAGGDITSEPIIFLQYRVKLP